MILRSFTFVDLLLSNMLSSRPFPDILPLYKNPVPNCPEKTIVNFQVHLPPNGSTPPHTHAGAVVFGNVVSGYVYNKMNNEPMKLLGPGETFMEAPGCRHKISDNASTTESATLVATLIVDTKVVEENGIEGLVVIDEEYRAMVADAQGKQKAHEKA